MPGTLRSAVLVGIIGISLANGAQVHALSYGISTSGGWLGLSQAVRLQGALLNSEVREGAQLGISLIRYGWFAPQLTVEGGRFFPAESDSVGRRVWDGSSFSSPLLRQFNHYFANVYLGFEIHSPTVTFFARAGLSCLQSNVSQVADAIAYLVEANERSARQIRPSAKLGLTVRF